MEKSLSISPEEAKHIFNWFGHLAFEVDIQDKDIALLERLEPLLPEEFKGSILRYKEKYKNQ